MFANPPMLSSRDGRLDVELVAAPGTYTIDGRQFQGMLYNGAYVQPVWRVRLGSARIDTAMAENDNSAPVIHKTMRTFYSASG